jgi:lipopolysaccharide assembly LptE-like protein
MRFAPSASRIAWLVPTLILCATATGCASDGHFEILGYTTRPPYDTSIRTVYVPMFGNKTYMRGIEFEITKAIVKEIEWKSPYKVVDNREAADTELSGTVVSRRKGIININQLGEVREAEISLSVEVVWKDLRSGKILSLPNGIQIRDGFGNRDPDAKIPAVLITPTGTYIPELGGNNASAEAQLTRQLAQQVVHMMENWNANCRRSP